MSSRLLKCCEKDSVGERERGSFTHVQIFFDGFRTVIEFSLDVEPAITRAVIHIDAHRFAWFKDILAQNVFLPVGSSDIGGIKSNQDRTGFIDNRDIFFWQPEPDQRPERQRPWMPTRTTLSNAT